MKVSKSTFYTTTILLGLVLAIAVNVALDAGCTLQGAITWHGHMCI